MTLFNTPLEFPASPRGALVDDFHGTEVADPYRWLEDIAAPQVQQWVRAQNRLTEGLLSASPWRALLRQRLGELYGFERRSAVALVRGDFYFWHNTGLQPQPVLMQQSAGAPQARVVLDPNTLSADGTVAVADAVVSPDGRWLAYSVADGGSDWRAWHVRNLASLEDQAEVLRWARFSSAAWLQDSTGFLYGRYPEPDASQQQTELRLHELRFHRLGQAQHDDHLVYCRPDHPTWVFGPRVSRCGRWLAIDIWDGNRHNRVHLVDLHQPGWPVQPLLDAQDAGYSFIDSHVQAGREELLFLTDAGAPMGRVVAINPLNADPAAWREVLAEGPQRLEQVRRCGAQLLMQRLQHAASCLQRVPLKGGQITELPLPTMGAISDLVVDAAYPAGRFVLGFSSFTVAPTLLQGSADEPGLQPLFQPSLGFDARPYETVLDWATSTDGTRVPLHVTRRRGMALDGSKPCLLVGYGGFNQPLRPGFAVPRLAWLEMGGIYVQALLRGGGEYDGAWHDAGRLQHKQRAFDDFIAAAEHLVASGHTRCDKLAIHGGSNGGLLVAACMTQRPDLFAAVVPAVGVLDMLRYHRFTIGAAWAGDYGRADDPQQFQHLLRYSPLHRLQVGQRYPPTLLLTADHDDRVWPAHSYKFAAALQHAQSATAPVLIRVETRAGHGAGKSPQADIGEKADMYTFIAEALGLPAPARWNHLLDENTR